MERIVIVGAGECGACAALALRERGFQGAITLVGREPHLPYERPPLSKSRLADGAGPRLVAEAARFAAADITLMTEMPVLAIARAAHKVQLADGRALAYDRLVLATGALARSFPGVPADARRIRSLRTYADALAIGAHLAPGRRLVIIGAGFIGLELAALARQAGVDVTVVEGQDRVLSRGVPAEIAAVVAERHRAEGVRLLCGQRIAGLTEDAGAARVTSQPLRGQKVTSPRKM